MRNASGSFRSGIVRQEQQIVRLDVAMDHAALEGVLQSQRRLADEVAGLVHRQRAVRLHQLGEVGPFDVFHDEQVGAVDLVGVVGADDVRVRQVERRRGSHAESAGGPLGRPCAPCESP